MARYPKNVNAIYISERMQKNLRHIQKSTLTSIVAPMGYGKTTAALWYLDERGSGAMRYFASTSTPRM